MTNFPDFEIDGAAVETMIMDLGRHGASHGTGVSRATYTPEWESANALLRSWGEAAGLGVRMDTVGNLWMRAEGTEGGKAIVTGSHIDSQLPGGRYDGALGIIAGLAAVTTLVRAFGPPKRPVEVVSLCEEEGSRFPGAGFWGSRGIVGRMQPDDPQRVRDYTGRPIAEAMREVGLDPARATEAKRDDIAAFLELHIEQGPVLEAADLPVAVVSGITSLRHTEVRIGGVANHAGAFPMDMRRDPMAGFAEIATAVLDHTISLGRPAVTTIGRIKSDPNGKTIVPLEVAFTLDARHPDGAAALAMHEAHAGLMTAICERRGLTLDMAVSSEHLAVPCDPALVETLRASAEAQGIAYQVMASGAGHDSQQMAEICPVAMIFVRSEDGRSHTPEEFSTIDDIVKGIAVLAGALHRLAWQ